MLCTLTGIGGGDDGGGGSGGSGGGSEAPIVVLDYPTSGAKWFSGRVTGHASDPSGDLTEVTVSVAGPNRTDTWTVVVDANGEFDTALPTYGIGYDVTVTLTAHDATGAQSSDSASAVQGCSGQTQPAYDTNTPPTWYGDFYACGYQTSAHWLSSGPYTSIDQGKAKYFWQSRPDNGSMIMITGNVGNDASNLSTLSSIRQDLIVQWSTWIDTFDGLPSGLTVGRDVIINYNNGLTDVSGLANLAVTASTPRSIQIVNNPALPACAAEAVIDELRSRGWNGEALVVGNGVPLATTAAPVPATCP